MLYIQKIAGVLWDPIDVTKKHSPKSNHYKYLIDALYDVLCVVIFSKILD